MLGSRKVQKSSDCPHDYDYYVDKLSFILKALLFNTVLDDDDDDCDDNDDDDDDDDCDDDDDDDENCLLTVNSHSKVPQPQPTLKHFKHVIDRALPNNSFYQYLLINIFLLSLIHI